MVTSLYPKQLVGQTTPRQFPPRSFVPLTYNCAWRIEAGAMRSVTWLKDGTVVALGFWGTGDIIDRTLASESVQIECLTKVEATLLMEWQQEPEALLSYSRQLEELAVIRSHRKVDAMLLQLLSWLANKFGREVGAGRLIDFRLTHQDIAELLGTTRVTITRTLNQFEQQGLIDRRPVGRIVLKETEVWHYEI
ncbi:MAG: Crp/Fnr family transcriptional regulator [Tildeniella nuda ZEHNDER 1965/U140]|nr:Crp/Fnr family transcriptional regulator [Tildeniella nuda ZEHNDER 1965/U140]